MPIPHLKPSSQNIQVIVPQKKRKRKFLKKRKTPSSQKGWGRKIIKFFLWLIVLGTISGALGLTSLVWWYSRDLPDPNKLIKREIPLSTKIYDRTGQTVLYEIHGAQNRTFVPLERVSPYAVQATIAIEDKDFYKHKGFSLWGIFRGVVIAKLKGKRMQGGSTITQQLIKNAILTNERTIRRKIKELILAWQIEKKFSKKEILQMYFNEIPYGSTAYGIEAASNLYFGKPAQDLTIAEGAILAALPQAPTYYSPYGSHQDKLFARQRYILKLMKEQGYIDEEQYQEALGEKIKFAPHREKIIAPHFVMYVKEILTQRYGERMVEQGGLSVITTLDLSKQEKAQKAIDAYWKKNKEKYNAHNAALVAIDTKTGQILAMVGSHDYFDTENDGNVNVAIRPRQPGSSLKPLVYLTAFSKGYTPKTILFDVETNFGVFGAKPYIPHNYDSKYHGPITMEKALAGSLNIPAVKTLYLAGVDKVIKNAQALGYTTLKDRNRYGLSLVLGGAEVKLLEHVGAYAAFAREGVYHPITPILEVKNSQGKIIEQYQKRERQVLDTQATRQLNKILSDNSLRAYVFGEDNYLNLGDRPVAAKTGTTNDYRDAWTIGYTPSLACGVWVGNNDNSPMKRGAAGGVVAAPVWHKFMLDVLGPPGKGAPVENFTPPQEEEIEKGVLKGEIEDTITLKIDKFSQKLATEFTPPEAIIEKTFKNYHSILYYVNKDDPRGPQPEHPEDDPQFKAWEEGIKKWLKEQSQKEGEEKLELPPTEYDDIHTPENRPSLSILNIEDNQEITSEEIFIKIDTSAPRGVSEVRYYLDNNIINKINTPPFDLYWVVDVNNGPHTLKVVALDDVLNQKEAIKKININIPYKPLNIIWFTPQANQKINFNNFPTRISIAVSYVARLKKIDFYSQNLNTHKEKLISSVVKPQEKTISIQWPRPSQEGFYKIIIKVTNVNEKQTIYNGPIIDVRK